VQGHGDVMFCLMASCELEPVIVGGGFIHTITVIRAQDGCGVITVCIVCVCLCVCVCVCVRV
jgi:small neutral amino acid transporter SnatA (MarC family)